MSNPARGQLATLGAAHSISSVPSPAVGHLSYGADHWPTDQSSSVSPVRLCPCVILLVRTQHCPALTRDTLARLGTHCHLSILLVFFSILLCAMAVCLVHAFASSSEIICSHIGWWGARQLPGKHRLTSEIHAVRRVECTPCTGAVALCQSLCTRTEIHCPKGLVICSLSFGT